MREDTPPSRCLIVTQARLETNGYTLHNEAVSLITLGGWKRSMAPPTLAEFILTLVIGESLGMLVPWLGSHIGTKGCVWDFNAELGDTREKVLRGFICDGCRAELAAAGYLDLADRVLPALGRSWLGTPRDPASPAGIAANMGYNLFIAKDVEPTTVERLRSALVTQSQAMLVTIIGGIIVVLASALLLVALQIP